MINLEAPLAAYLRAPSYVQEDSHERQQGVIGKFLLDNSSAIPPDNWFSDFRPRDAAAFAPDSQALLAKVRRGQVKTVVVSNLGRWGTADVDEFFAFRGVLLRAGCTLWSVEDGDLTSKEMADIITIIVKAEQMREDVRRGAKTIATGDERLAQAGHWTGGKSSPFGYDRLCVDAAGRALWLLHYETPPGSWSSPSPRTAPRTAPGRRRSGRASASAPRRTRPTASASSRPAPPTATTAAGTRTGWGWSADSSPGCVTSPGRSARSPGS
jgi:hypothetical protein